MTGLLILAVWAALIWLAFGVGRECGRVDETLEREREFERRNGGWRSGRS